MSSLDRRRFLADLLVAVPALGLGACAGGARGRRGQRPLDPRPQPAPPSSATPGIRVANGEDRFHVARSVGVSTTTFKVAAEDTRGALFAMEQANTSRGGPPLHLHRDVDELWYVTAGEYLVEVGGRQFRAGPGDCVLGPRGVPHRWAFVGDEPGRMLVTFTPAGRMQEWFALPRAPGAYMRSDPALFREYGMELLGPPLPL